MTFPTYVAIWDKISDVRILVGGETATVQVHNSKLGHQYQDHAWEDFYRLKFDDLARGLVSAETLGRQHQDVMVMARAVALAAEYKVRKEYQEIAKGLSL